LVFQNLRRADRAAKRRPLFDFKKTQKKGQGRSEIRFVGPKKERRKGRQGPCPENFLGRENVRPSEQESGETAGFWPAIALNRVQFNSKKRSKPSSFAAIGAKMRPKGLAPDVLSLLKTIKKVQTKLLSSFREQPTYGDIPKKAVINKIPSKLILAPPPNPPLVWT
jgi:hypothetical protein